MKAKKGEGEGRRQKAIIGIVMATIMLASVLTLMVPASEGRPAANQIDAWDTVYIGEQGLIFDTDGDGVYGGATDLNFILEGVLDTLTEGIILTVDAQGWAVPYGEREGMYTVGGIPVNDAGLEPGDAIYIDEAWIRGDIVLNTPAHDSIVGRSMYGGNGVLDTLAMAEPGDNNESVDIIVRPPDNITIVGPGDINETVNIIVRPPDDIIVIPPDYIGIPPDDFIVIPPLVHFIVIPPFLGDGNSIVGRSVPRSSEIVFKVETNFGWGIHHGWGIPGACVDIKLIGPDGVEFASIDGQALENITILETTMYVGNLTPTTTAPPYPDAIDLTDLDIGTYRVKFKTNKATCNMLDISSPEYMFEVRKEELSIMVERTIVGRGEDIRLTVLGNPKAFYYLIVTGVDTTAPPEIKATYGDVKVVDTAGDAYPVTRTPNLAAWIKTGIDCIADVIIDTAGADDRTYTIKVYDTSIPDYPNFVPDKEFVSVKGDKVSVKVEKPRLTLDIPSTAIVGKEVTIEGTVSAGDYVDILINDGGIAYFDDVPVDCDNEFEVDWDTARLATGFYWHVIDGYIDCPYDSFEEINAAGIDEDDSTIIWLVAPGLTAEQSRNAIAEGDDYTIKGTATGVDDVDIVLVGPNGYPLEDPGLGILNGLEIRSSLVTYYNEFSEDIKMRKGVNSGTWKANVLAPGLDGTYGDLGIGAGELTNINTTQFAGKTQDQIVAILENHTVNVTGSDDLLEWFAFEVKLPYVRLDPIENVTIGEPLEITGKTNREPGTKIVIWTIEGPIMLPAVITEVEWTTPNQGIFSAAIDTTGAATGNYTLKADDREGNNDTATVELAPPSPAPVPIIKLNPVEDVVVGEHLVVSGTTIWEYGHWIIVTVRGPTELPAVMVEVEKGTFCAIFDTTHALTGSYTVKADDGCGHTDEAIVNITLVPNGAFSSVIITDVNPTKLHPGDTKEVVLTVKNNGGREVRDVRLIFEGTRNVYVIGSTIAQINRLNSWSSKEVKITVHVEEGTPNGVYSIPVICSWNEYYFDPAMGYVTKPKGSVELGISFNIIGVPPPPAPEVSISTDKKEYPLGDVINTTIRLSNPTGNAQNMLFKWYFIRDYNNWTKIEQTTINLSANSDQTSTASIPVEDWGNKSFCGCYIVSLTNTTTNNVVSVDSASWIYLPSTECKSKTSAEIAKGIKEIVEGVELQLPG